MNITDIEEKITELIGKGYGQKDFAKELELVLWQHLHGIMTISNNELKYVGGDLYSYAEYMIEHILEDHFETTINDMKELKIIGKDVAGNDKCNY